MKLEGEVLLNSYVKNVPPTATTTGITPWPVGLRPRAKKGAGRDGGIRARESSRHSPVSLQFAKVRPGDKKKSKLGET